MDIRKYNVKWDSQSMNSGESMPGGGFDTGANIWVENNEMFLYVDRSGSFDENNQMLKLGRFRFSFSRNPFVKCFSQELVLDKGNVKISGDDFNVVVWFDTHKPVCHIDIKAKNDIEITATYESWRTEDRELLYNERMAAASYVSYPGKVITYKDSILHDDETITFYHQNRNNKLLFDFLVNLQNLNEIKDKLYNPQKDLVFGGKIFGDGCKYVGKTSGSYADIEYEGFKLKSLTKKKHSFVICFNTENVERIEEWQNDLNSLCKLVMEDTLAEEKTQNWWESFWRRSYIDINSSKDHNNIGYEISKNYTLFRYMLGCNACGKYPTKFNGGLFTTDAWYSVGENHKGKTPDFRMWGGGSFTAQNQRMVYWGLLKSGDFDMMHSQFNYYNKLLKNAEERTKEYWGHNGCSFTEQLENIGLPIAWNWGFDETDDILHKRPKNFDKTEQKGPWTRYEYITQVEFAYMIIMYYRYSKKDISKYIPFIESTITFFFEHYEQIHFCNTGGYYNNGKIVISPSTALETYKDALNPTDVLSGLKGVISELCNMPEYVDVEHYKKQLEKVPNFKIGKVNGEEIIEPAYSWTSIINVEIPQLYPVFPYGIYGLGREGLDIAVNTWRNVPNGQKDYISWHQDGIFTARLGLIEEAVEINTKKLKDSERRFSAFWGPGHDWAPDHNWGGSGMIGIQEMLVQQYDNTVYLFPAWPKEWDVNFKLHLMNGIVVAASNNNGDISYSFEGNNEDIKVKVCIDMNK